MKAYNGYGVAQMIAYSKEVPKMNKIKTESLPEEVDPTCLPIIEALDKLTKDQRTEVFYWFCVDCGNKTQRTAKYEAGQCFCMR